MTYFNVLKTTRWCKNWKDGVSTFTARLGYTGRNGVAVPDLGKLEEASIRSFFLEHGVEQNATEKELWWTHERFGFHVSSIVGDDTIYQAGYKFEISEQAFNKVFK